MLIMLKRKLTNRCSAQGKINCGNGQFTPMMINYVVFQKPHFLKKFGMGHKLLTC